MDGVIFNERGIGKLMLAYKISRQQAVILLSLFIKDIMTYADFVEIYRCYRFCSSKASLKAQICQIRKKTPSQITIKIIPNIGYTMERGKTLIQKKLGEIYDRS